MALDEKIRAKLPEILKFIGSESSKNLTQLLNKPVTFGEGKVSDSLMPGDTILMSDEKLLVTAPISEPIAGHISIFASDKLALTVANLMTGGSGDVADGTALYDNMQKAFAEAVGQTISSVVSALASLKDSPKLTVGQHTLRILDEKDPKTLAKPENVLDPIAIKINVQITDKLNSSIILELNADTLGILANEFDKVIAEQNAKTQGPAKDSGTSANSSVADVNFADIKDKHDPNNVDEGRNLNLLMDIRMGLTVELGRAEMPLRDILKLAKGSVIELDRLSGEPVDLFVNNKLIARGEVVVIDDNFGLRITQLAGKLNLAKEMEASLAANE